MNLPPFFPVTAHTDFVGPGSTFVVIQGMQEDGMRYVPLALERGARTLVVHENARFAEHLRALLETYNVSVVRVADCRLALAQLSAHAAGYPTHKLRIIAVTGTKGKTTTVWLLDHMLRSAGLRTARLSTVGNSIGDHTFATHLTTQHPDYLQQFFALCVAANVTYVVMEVAAQAWNLHRIAGIVFDAVVFTNFAQEHGEFYATMQDYFSAKAQICAQRTPTAPLFLNGDDSIVRALAATQPQTITYGLEQPADWQVHVSAGASQGVSLELVHAGGSLAVHSSLVGRYNAYNCTAACVVSSFLGVSAACIQKALASFVGVPGRTEQYHLANGALCIIDYAHNPSSYEQILHVARQLRSHVIVVCGAGGGRSAQKRPIMGSIAATYADVVIFTTDNPRDEDPREIIAMMRSAIAPEHEHKIIVELDRAQAIYTAYKYATEHSVILLLGKGNERYQVIGKERYPFDERAIIATLQ